MAESNRECTFAKRTVSASLCPPACRMVVLRCLLSSDGQVVHQIEPVVALRCRMVQFWRISHGLGYTPELTGTEGQLIEQGWELDGLESVVEPLIIGPDWQDIDAPFEWEDNHNWCVVTAEWPPAEDEARLADLIKSMSAHLSAKAKQRKSP